MTFGIVALGNDTHRFIIIKDVFILAKFPDMLLFTLNESES